MPVKPPRHYSRAPITEALIDIQVDLPAALILANSKSSTPRLHLNTRSRIRVLMFRCRLSSAHLRLAPRGRLKRFGDSPSSVLDGRQVVQVRRDGFTFSRLSPYQTWEDLRTEARRLWGALSFGGEAIQMTRVAVRYINQIDIPLPMDDFADYLRTTLRCRRIWSRGCRPFSCASSSRKVTSVHTSC